MDKDLRLKQWHFILALFTFIVSSAVVWVSNDRRQTAFETMVSMKFTFQEGFNAGFRGDLDGVRKTANDALANASTALTLYHEGNKK